MLTLIDADVLIDVRRATPAALAWIEGAPTDEIEVPAPIVLELLLGCRNRPDLRSTRGFLATFAVAYPTPGEFDLAVDLFEQHHLAAGIGTTDCIVAAIARTRGQRLWTFNRRHFAVVAGLDVQEPYTR